MDLLTKSVTVVLVDDTPDILMLLRSTFEVEDGVFVCAEVHDGLEAILAWREHHPDVMVMDLRMPVLSGMEAAEQILAVDPQQRIVLFSAAFTTADRERAAALGVAECFDKQHLDCLPEVVLRLGVAV